ncbi:MAG: protein-export chaperone SecB, partial [Pseudomonadota bacterium]
MAEEQAAPVQPQMRVLGQYVRDMSFENIVAQKGASPDVQPDVQVQVNLDAKKRAGDNQYETA